MLSPSAVKFPISRFQDLVQKFFPFPSRSFWLEFHICSHYFGAKTENVNLAAIMDLSCFSLYLFSFLSFFFLKFFRRDNVRQLWLDKGGWVIRRAGRKKTYLGWTLKMKTHPPTKKEVSKSAITNLAIRITYGSISNKPVNQRYLKI